MRLTRPAAGPLVLARPRGWRSVPGDRGSVSFERLRATTIVGHLNATPRSGAVTLDDWLRLRVIHNAQQGDREVSQWDRQRPAMERAIAGFVAS